MFFTIKSSQTFKCIIRLHLILHEACAKNVLSVVVPIMTFCFILIFSQQINELTDETGIFHIGAKTAMAVAQSTNINNTITEPLHVINENQALATYLIAAIGAITAFLAIRQFKNTQKSTEGQLYVQLRQMMSSQYSEIQQKLRRGEGVWGKNDDKGPMSEDDPSKWWAKVDEYLRFFEYCYTLIEKKLISIKTFKSLYWPYINDIMRNKQIKQHVEEEEWQNFKELFSKMRIEEELENRKKKNKKKFP